MSAPVSTNDIVRHLSELGRQLGGNVDALESADRQATEARHAANLAYSKAFLSAEGSVEQRKHLAVVQTERLAYEAEVAEAVVRHLKRRTDEIRERIGIGRSYGAAIRSEMSLVSAGGTP